MRRTLVAAVPLPLLALTLACAAPEPVTGDGAVNSFANHPISHKLANGLRQTVTVSDNRPRSGEVFSVSSVVVNEGNAPVNISSRICGLDVKHDANVEFGATGFAMCAGYSRSGPLAPGDSVTSSMPVSLDAKTTGVHVLSVRHLLTPDAWVDVPVMVVK